MADDEDLNANDALVGAIGETTLMAFDRNPFSSISALLDPESGEVTFDMDLARPSRRERRRVIETIMSNVYPKFAADDVAFTFVFSEHDDAIDHATHQRVFAVA